MCLISVQLAGSNAPLDRSVFDNGWNANPHGAGYMFPDFSGTTPKLVIRKPYTKLKKLIRDYTVDWQTHGAKSHFVLHFRYATHGVKDKVNTHPHVLADGRCGLVHNGILDEFGYGQDTRISDTVFFCRTVLAHREPSQLVSATFGEYLANLIGKSNKLALLTANGDLSIVNEDKGIWDGATWYSNGTFLKACRPLIASPFDWDNLAEEKWREAKTIDELAEREAIEAERDRQLDAEFDNAIARDSDEYDLFDKCRNVR